MTTTTQIETPIIEDFPPIWDKVIAAGMRPNPDTVLFAYAGAIYAPRAKNISNDLLVHEGVHLDQQGDDADAWWDRYIQDAYFRIDQEAEAYAEQYDFLCHDIKDRNQRNMILHRMAIQLSGAMYGNVITHSAAKTMIKSKSNV